MFRDLLRDRLPDDSAIDSLFEKFYAELPPGLSTSAILNHLFFHRENSLENIGKLKGEEAFIRKATGADAKGLYS
jgi:hypothetical protein